MTGGNKIYDNLIHIELIVSYVIGDDDYNYEMIIYEVIMVIPYEVMWQCISFILCACIAQEKVNHGGLTRNVSVRAFLDNESSIIEPTLSKIAHTCE